MEKTQIIAAYYLTLLHYAVIDNKLTLPSTIRDILINNIAENEVEWILEATYAEVFSLVAYDGIKGVINWSDEDLISRHISDEYILMSFSISEQINLDIKKSISSLDLILFHTMYEAKVMLDLSSAYSQQELSLISF
jgi:hypothetical protein